MEITIVIDIGKPKGLTVNIDEEVLSKAGKGGYEDIMTIIRTTSKHMIENIMEGLEYVPK